MCKNPEERAVSLMEAASVLCKAGEAAVKLGVEPKVAFASANAVLLDAIENYLEHLVFSWHKSPNKRGWENKHTVLVVSIRQLQVSVPLSILEKAGLYEKVKKAMNTIVNPQLEGKVSLVLVGPNTDMNRYGDVEVDVYVPGVASPVVRVVTWSGVPETWTAHDLLNAAYHYCSAGDIDRSPIEISLRLALEGESYRNMILEAKQVFRHYGLSLWDGWTEEGVQPDSERFPAEVWECYLTHRLFWFVKLAKRIARFTPEVRSKLWGSLAKVMSGEVVAGSVQARLMLLYQRTHRTYSFALVGEAVVTNERGGTRMKSWGWDISPANETSIVLVVSHDGGDLDSWGFKVIDNALGNVQL